MNKTIKIKTLFLIFCTYMANKFVQIATMYSIIYAYIIYIFMHANILK